MTNSGKKPFSRSVLSILDIEAEIQYLTHKIQEDVLIRFKRKGAIVGISGGIDSSVTLALAVKALGPDRVTGIMLPEKESSSDSLILAQRLADQFGVKTLIEEI